MVKVDIECPYEDCHHPFKHELHGIYKVVTINCPKCNMPIKWSKPGIVEKGITEKEIKEYTAPRDPGGILSADFND